MEGFRITQNKLAVSSSVSPQFWTNLQSHHDLEVELDAIGDQLEEITPIQAA